jgi:hypothetical protein
MVKVKTVMLGLAFAAGLWSAPAGAATLAECRQACRDGIQACVQSCNGRPQAGRCKAACRNPRVRRACIRLCRNNGAPG